MSSERLSLTKDWMAIAAILVTLGGYVFEVRNNTTEIKSLKVELARKDVVAEQISSLRNELIAIKTQLAASADASLKAYQKSEENNAILQNFIRIQIDKKR